MFALRINLPLDTLRHWEQCKRKLTGSSSITKSLSFLDVVQTISPCSGLTNSELQTHPT
jgi:DNA-binding transcriptional regulator YiaG